jgi:hypothetical protein
MIRRPRTTELPAGCHDLPAADRGRRRADNLEVEFTDVDYFDVSF